MDLENIPPLLYQQFARVGQALASQQRVRILNLLCQRDRTVDDLAEELGQSSANTSAHLKILREAHLIDIRREGRNAFCSLGSGPAIRLWMALRDFALEEDPVARELMRAYERDVVSVGQILGEDALEMVRNGDAILVDLRPPREFEAGHLPMAQSIPVEELATHLKELPKDKTVFIYRRSPFCVGTVKAAKILKEAGFDTRRLRDGVAEWRAAGRALEQESEAVGTKKGKAA
ncbi:ArsR/SmtB family transcription factor [Geomesophilobacter sediminis]|uniref:ArsR family transcriptional regulator n=1 Tax=Geomesophilobacter sediminis TaxID=2798584 RepID=A0A8J7JHH9_9BACT|nr:metalloregulator ArsR/SmtB family transcription factor [Geomesophilobacter sediminis]MBJ6723930.1 ArsR family transcriptional regulator [Geomesophilobacter sediminis]